MYPNDKFLESRLRSASLVSLRLRHWSPFFSFFALDHDSLTHSRSRTKWGAFIFHRKKAVRMSGVAAMLTAVASGTCSSTPPAFHVAIVGGGITGCCLASMLSQTKQIQPFSTSDHPINIRIDLFDQGRSGVGGRSSHRVIGTNDGSTTISSTSDASSASLAFDHGCQFFRADTLRMQSITQDWINKGIAKEWQGNFQTTNTHSSTEFFGFPSNPPFYIGSSIQGIKSIPKQIIERIIHDNCENNKLKLFEGTRVAKMTHENNKWKLYGVSGDPAYHDTAEERAQEAPFNRLTNIEYDTVILTDVSSSCFDGWHRASAGVPEDFAIRVRERVGARTPLFTAMVAYESRITEAPDAMSFQDDRLWFAARSSSKGIAVGKECWTLVSTPEYAINEIERTPMRNTVTGDFIPQSKEYLCNGPGKDLSKQFEKILVSKFGVSNMPRTIFLDAQRWGSALPHGWSESPTNTSRTIAGTEYNTGPSSLFPTRKQNEEHVRSFITDDERNLYQAGDMVSGYTPGFEGAVLSAVELGEYLLGRFQERMHVPQRRSDL